MARTRRYLLNCTNCSYARVMDVDAYMHVDYERDVHETSIRNALAVGPYCPRGSVAIAQLRDGAEVSMT